MDRDTRGHIERATQRLRKLLEADFAGQLEGTFDVLLSGAIAEAPGPHLDGRDCLVRDKIVAAIKHKQAAGMKAADAVADFIRDAAFTTVNRFVALKMLEARGLILESVSAGERSAGFKEFYGLAPGLALLENGAGYRLYLESIFDELATEVKVLFDRRVPAAALWPRRQAFEELVAALNAPELAPVWGEDETIGWMYQYFNSGEERRELRADVAPQNSRELAVRNQFFTPRYVVQFLTENTLGRTWYEMRRGQTELVDRCVYMVRQRGEAPPDRPKKDPRDIKVLDPACGSGHFLLYAFDLLQTIYDEAWADQGSPASAATGRTLRQDWPDRSELRRQVPVLILRHNLHGVDIDARCAQIAQLALWMRAQRAFAGMDVSRAERPQVQKTNIVVAEPMPGEPDLLAGFASQLGDPNLRELFEKVVARLKLAGELGLLLDLGDLLPNGGGKGQLGLFRSAEERILTTVRDYATHATAGEGARRRMFSEDTVQGLGLVELAGQAFDVVLMNPPFGDPTPAGKSEKCPELIKANHDIGGAFVLAAERRWAPAGMVGVLSSTTLWFKPTVAEWRKEALLEGSHVVASAAHFGGDVLDGATVSASAVALETSSARRGAHAVFFRLLLDTDKAARLRDLVVRAGEGARDEHTYLVDLSSISAFRGAPLAYWISASLRARLAALPALEGNGAEVRVGVQASDDPRFVRAWWEVPADRVALGKTWAPFAKSSEYSPSWDDITWVVRWDNQGQEIRAFDKSRPQNHSYFGRAGVTFTRRSVLGFNPRAFPAACGFSDMGSVAFPQRVEAEALLGYLSSRPVEYVISFSNGTLQGQKGVYQNHYEVGQIKDLPWPNLDDAVVSRLADHGRALATAAMHLQDDDETTHQYLGHPALARAPSVCAAVDTAIEERRHHVGVARAARAALDPLVAAELGFEEADLREMQVEFARCAPPTSGPWSETDPDDLGAEAERIASALFGFAIGRLDIRPAMTGQAPSTRGSAFDPLPPRAPAHLANPGSDYPVSFPRDGILVSDPGEASRDVGRAVAQIAALIWGERGPTFEQELAGLLGTSDLAEYFAAASSRKFCEDHRARYSKGRRAAPIYWHLATPSASYGVWIYIQAFTKDTFFTIQEIVTSKLKFEQEQLDGLRREIGPAPTAAQRKDLSTRESLVEELRAFLDEVRRVAPLWDPDLNDGVPIIAAPLWRLFPQHRSWQKECKATWDALCAGEYDWAQLAMRLWPDRVVRKCAGDRSLAIAHGLEDVFWYEVTEGKDAGKWKTRAVPAIPLDEIVRERSSRAVEAALMALLSAPTPANRRREPKVSRRSRRPGKPDEAGG